MSTELITHKTVDQIFERFHECLPQYVPAFPSLMRGIIVTLLITVMGIVIGLKDKNETSNTKDIVVKTRWILVILIFLYVGLQVGDIVKDKHYMLQCLSTNKQHFANIHWLKEYKNALK